MYKVIVAGGRDFNDYGLLETEVTDFLFNYLHLEYDEVEIVSGHARGADTLGEIYAQEFGFKVKLFLPDWSKGNIGGIIRNHQMGDYADALIAFWDGKSRGTKDMITYATNKGLKVKVVRYE